jgi:hypothetical protein
MIEMPSYYEQNKERVLSKTRQKQLCECGVLVSYSNRKCHKTSVRHIIWEKSRENEQLRDSSLLQTTS